MRVTDGFPLHHRMSPGTGGRRSPSTDRSGSAVEAFEDAGEDDEHELVLLRCAIAANY
jgi:hypothetical protein